MNKTYHNNHYDDKRNKNALYFEEISKINYETKYISIQTLQELQKQSETLKLTDGNLNKSNEMLIESNKILNLMSWSGWFMSFIPFKDYLSNLFIRKPKLERFELTNPKLINSNIQYIENLSTNVDYLDFNEIEKEELNKLEKDIIELSYIGKEIGNQLDLHNSSLDIMNEKIQTLNDITKKMNKKTKDLL